MTIATVARKHPLLELDSDTPNWAGAACRSEDPELWFHDDFHGTAATAATEEAKSICRHCDIREQCLAWALAHRIPFGVWGALDTDERNNRAGQCRTCTTRIPAGSRAVYCEACRNKARARQDRSRAKKRGVT